MVEGPALYYYLGGKRYPLVKFTTWPLNRQNIKITLKLKFKNVYFSKFYLYTEEV